MGVVLIFLSVSGLEDRGSQGGFITVRCARKIKMKRLFRSF